ncbi:M48 family metalloprotease [Thermodesulfobacteriota bacterium]
MFNNIIYFIIVLLIFNISYPDHSQEKSLTYSFVMTLACWFVFSGYCRLGFRRLIYRYKRGTNSRLTNEYHGLVLRLSILAIFLFSLDVYIFHLKYWLQTIPGVKQFLVLQGILALSLFIFYLITIWYFSYPAYALAFQAKIRKRSFIISNFKLNLPILFPWLILSFAYDLIGLSPWSGPDSFLGQPEGQMIFFAVFLCFLMIFMPPLIQYWWGCKPFASSDRIDELKNFLSGMRFRYSDLLRWPIFEGRMMTAGIMGILPRYRYILMTDSLIEILSVKELKAVMAHEVGHARYRHLIYYVFFFLGYMVLSFGSFDIFFNLVAAHPYFTKVLGGGELQAINLFYLVLSIPILLTMFIYFRFIMGFFMRHFERQADLFSAVTMGSPAPTISSLEKIALLSGKSRDLPSWHHFSIKERVDYLWRILNEPGLVSRHNRLVGLSFITYLICIVGLGYLLNFSPVKQVFSYKLASNMLNQQLSEEPDNVLLLQNLAMVYHKMNKYSEAIETYERLLILDRAQAVTLNNLAWLLITSADKELRDPKRALVLAKEAVALEKSPIFLDTLAESHYANGSVHKAIDTIKEAISLEKKDDGYYRKQLNKYITSLEGQ